MGRRYVAGGAALLILGSLARRRGQTAAELAESTGLSLHAVYDATVRLRRAGHLRPFRWRSMGWHGTHAARWHPTPSGRALLGRTQE